MKTVTASLITRNFTVCTPVFFKISAVNKQSSSLLAQLPENLTVTGRFPHRELTMQKTFRCYELNIGIDTNIEVIVVSLTTWKAHHSPRAKPEGCGELPGSLMWQQWPKLRYWFLFYHDETKSTMNKQILSNKMLKFVPKLSLFTAWLHVHIFGSCDLIVSPW